MTVAYLANEFPSAVEPYVVDEIEELRCRGVRVVAGSVRRTRCGWNTAKVSAEIVLWPLHAKVIFRAARLCLWKAWSLLSILSRILFGREETLGRRLRALGHTFLGACYAAELQGREIEHIHVHHGYFGSWIAMTAARMLGVGYSLTLHGSDLLVDPAFLDVKLGNCSFCRTISEYNRRYILERYREIDPQKVIVVRLGVNVENSVSRDASERRGFENVFKLLSVGRLHAVKDHAFLVRACAELRERGLQFQCLIAGEGPERPRIEALIDKYELSQHITLLGQVERVRLQRFYDCADIVVLTSRSEGIPVVLMEAMPRGAIVLAPEITGIPELVIPGETGFLYQSGSMQDFVAQLAWIEKQIRDEKSQRSDRDAPRVTGTFELMREKARAHVHQHFNRRRNLQVFAESLMAEITRSGRSSSNENPILQQI